MGQDLFILAGRPQLVPGVITHMRRRHVLEPVTAFSTVAQHRLAVQDLHCTLATSVVVLGRRRVGVTICLDISTNRVAVEQYALQSLPTRNIVTLASELEQSSTKYQIVYIFNSFIGKFPNE